MKGILLCFFTMVLFFGCATNDLTIGVTDPAAVSIPNKIKTVGVLNRTNTITTGIPKDVDEIVSMEFLSNDSVVALKALDGLYDELKKNSRFTEVKNLKSIILNNFYINTFSRNIDKNEIIKICSQNKLDALFVLEFFDTQSSMNVKAKLVKKVILGKEIEVPETQATVSTLIRLGWRIYDASGEIIYDQFAASKNVVSTGRGVNPLKATAAVVGHKDLVENVAYSMGQNYAMDLLPIYHRVGREYYVKGTENFKIGKRLARAGNWNEAADYWNKEINNSKRKIAGRAYYNMALINEINGNIDDAIDWSGKSYTIYNNKNALRYLNVLKNRKRNMQKLARQQQE